MATTTLHIRNMVCNRCILVVRQLLEGLGLTPLHIELGKAIVQEELPPEAKAALNTALEAVGFELIDDRRSLLIERLRNAVIELAHYHDDGMRTNLSDYLSEKFHSDYSALSKLFSEMTGITLEKYYIAQRVGKFLRFHVFCNTAEYLFSRTHPGNQKFLGFQAALFRPLSSRRRCR